MDTDIIDVVDPGLRSAFVARLDAAHSALITELSACASAHGVASPSRASVSAFLVAFATSMRDADPLPASEWLRVAAIRYDRATLAAFVHATCDVIGAAALRSEDPGTLVVLVELLRVRLSSAARSTVTDADEVQEAVLATLRVRDEATCSHGQATAQLARRLADTLGVAPIVAERVEQAALFHDIGKLAVPDAVLLKPGPLDAEEWAVMREHAAWGGTLLFDIPQLASLAPIVRAHHERWDGKGYPDGLARENIPYEARIVAVADAFHAMTSDRPYRRAMTYGEAIEVLRQGRDSQWQPDIVDAMIGVAIAARNAHADQQLNAAQPPLLRIDPAALRRLA